MGRKNRSITGQSAKSKRAAESTASEDAADLERRRSLGRGGRSRKRQTVSEEDPDETIYDGPDAHFFQQDKIALNSVDGDDDEDSVEGDDVLRRIEKSGDSMMQKEGIMDLPTDEEDESDEDDEDEDDEGEDDEDDEEMAQTSPASSSESEEEDRNAYPPLIRSHLERAGGDDDLSSVDSDAEEDIARRIARLERRESSARSVDWGSDVRAYYDGDDASKRRRRPRDGGEEEEEDPAEEEERAADAIRAARMEDLAEEDYFDGEGGAEVTAEVEEGGDTEEVVRQEEGGVAAVRRMSARARKKYIARAHPELQPVLEHYKAEVVPEVGDVMKVFGDLLSMGGKQAEAVGATPPALHYLHAKKTLLLSSCANVCLYLLFKHAEVHSTGSSANTAVSNHPVVARLNTLHELLATLERKIESPLDLKPQMEALVKASDLMREEALNPPKPQFNWFGPDSEEEGSDATDATDADADGESKEEDDDNSSTGEEIVALQEEARFALRPSEVDAPSPAAGRKRHRAAAADWQEFGEEEADGDDTGRAARKLSGVANRISQKERREGVREAGGAEAETEETFAKKPREQNPEAEDALALMEQYMGKGYDKDSDEEEDDNGSDVSEDEEDEVGALFKNVKQKSQAKKEARKMLHGVAPKFPRPQEEVEGERTASRYILKNRGLVPHKPKINRNPRVKKREQYRKALIRRKGAVREVRKGEVEEYEGEATGVRTGISRSRKL